MPAAAPAIHRRRALAERLRARPFRVDRLKTGTPPRIDRNTIDYSRLEGTAGRRSACRFSRPWVALDMHPEQVMLPHHITPTNARHDIIRESRCIARRCSAARSRAWARAIARRSRTRSCASPTSTSHQVFVEPEGLNLGEVYPNGISTSLPFDVQQQLVNSMRGFEAGADHPAGLCDRIRLFRSARPASDARNPLHRRPLFCRADQRHHRLRGSGRAGPDRRRQRRGAGAGQTGR